MKLRKCTTCMPFFLLFVATEFNCSFSPKHWWGLCFEPRSGHLLAAIPLNYPQVLIANSPAGMGGYLCASPTRWQSAEDPNQRQDLCKYPQLLWAHGCNVNVISRMHHFATELLILLLFYTFLSLFTTVSWTLEGLSWLYFLGMWTPPSLILGIFSSCGFLC